VIALGTPRELIASLGAEHVVEFAVEDGAPVEPRRRALARCPACATVRARAPAWALSTSQSVPPVPGAARGGGSRARRDAHDAATHSATLEDVFVALTGRHLRDG
jgi:ABC-2 type transport system ATP-binding protein